MNWQRRRTNRKRRLFRLELLEHRWLLAGGVAQVGYFDTWDGGIVPSSDVEGITYHPSGALYLADAGIDEQPSIFNGDNLFETSLSGDQIFRGIASGNSEPTGITFNQFDGYFYVTDADSQLVVRLDSALDNPRYEFATEE